MSPSQMEPTGQSRWIWPFEILEQIGEGGMGVVYRARYVVNGREVALKMVPADITDKTALARFEREVEVLKTLKHPNIVRCFGGVCENNRRFYAMELLEAGSLEDQLQARGKFPWEEVVKLGLQMCEALKCSHEQGVIHRDIKPSNFLISPTGLLKLSDFGLASVNTANKITAAGKTAGTFLYMAPEQIRGHEVAPPTDLYALGCVLFELLTGEVPFLGETAGATLHLHCFGLVPRPSEKVLDCPVQLERLIMQLLEKDAKKRPQTADEVSRELKSIDESVMISQRKEYGSNFPTGYKPSETAVIEAAPRQTQTIEIPARWQLPGELLNRVTIGAISALALSLMLNGVLLMNLKEDPRWQQHWSQALQSSEASVRAEALAVYGMTADEHPSNVGTIARSLNDSSPMVRFSAVQALIYAAPHARNQLPVLIKKQKEDPDEAVRVLAGQAIHVIRESRSPFRFPWKLTIAVVFLLGAAGAAVTAWYRLKRYALS